jgi:hypothetical protein
MPKAEVGLITSSDWTLGRASEIVEPDTDGCIAWLHDFETSVEIDQSKKH